MHSLVHVGEDVGKGDFQKKVVPFWLACITTCLFIRTFEWEHVRRLVGRRRPDHLFAQ